MSTSNLARILQNELDRLAPRYASIHAEHAPLASYPTLASLVSRLTDPEQNKSCEAQRERSELLAIIIGAFQPTHDRLWGAILIAAFQPIFATTRLYGADPEERQAIFFAALIEVVEKLDVRQRPDVVHAIVWRSAKKVLVRKLRRQTAWADVGFGDDADTTPDPTSWLPEPLLPAWLLSRGKKDRPALDLVVRVQEWGSLRAYVAASCAALPPAERARVYGRLTKRHRRAIAELREILGGAPNKRAARFHLRRAKRGSALISPWLRRRRVSPTRWRNERPWGRPELVEFAMRAPLVLVERHADNRPTWVTTGMTRGQLVQRYGQGIVSRVLEGGDAHPR